ncbi:hypothetical protein ACFL2G_05400 [Candidatus Omnitrophota bacterium]
MLRNIILYLIEKETGFKVVIAAHPRSNYEERPDYFKGRECIRGKTIDLIRESKLVLCHCSTASNFTNLFYKPAVFMTCSELNKIHRHKNYYVKEFAKWFGKEPVSIDEASGINWDKELTVKRDHYDNYRNAYIKTENSEELPFAQIVANRLKKLER